MAGDGRERSVYTASRVLTVLELSLDVERVRFPERAVMTTPAPGTGEQEEESAFFRTFLEHLRGLVRKDAFELWFRELRLTRVRDGEAEFAVPSVFVRDWILKNYQPELQNAVQQSGKSVDRIRLSLETVSRRRVVPPALDQPQAAADSTPTPKTSNDMPTTDQTPATSDRSASTGQPAPGQASQPPVGHGRPVSNPGFTPRSHTQATYGGDGEALNPNYTFDQFVVGQSNRFGHAASFAVSENPGVAYNPMFLHGSVGLGKTHLLQAICHNILRRDSKARVVYMSCEDFTNRYIDSIQNQTVQQFRDFHRSLDVLVIDDVEFIAEKDKTQEEFFHTFNALFNAQKQIVISSDRPPPEIPKIQERLVSRFKWGLVTKLKMPDFETRSAIVRRKAKLRAHSLPDDTVNMMADQIARLIDSNIRELEGAVIKVVGFANLTGRIIDEELIAESLEGLETKRNASVSVEDVMSLVTAEFTVSQRELTGKGRKQTVSTPRQIAMHLIRKHTDLSLEEIGKLFGNRDHTTVLYGVQRVQDRKGDDKAFRQLVDKLEARLAH